MFDLACHCGTVRLHLAVQPDYINECNCSLCGKAGVRWAYVSPDQATVEGETGEYSRRDKEDPAAVVHFCTTCGSTTHFTLSPSAVARFGNTLMGINMRLADPAALAGIELRFPDGAAWSGEGDFSYVREAQILGS